jgi:DNA modification methylase
VTVRIINADVLDGLKSLPDESVNCVVTSPPYWGLRDYGVAGQIGLESTPQEFVVRMVEVFREVRRVLRRDGVCFMNLGDSYAGSWGAQSRDNPGDRRASTIQGGSTLSARQIKADPKETSTGSLKNTPGMKAKDLIGIPWRVALALQDDGWWLRQDIIWHKPNPMPESVTDRCTKAHEYIFLLTKSERYWWDQEAIKEQGGLLPSGNSQHKYVNGDPINRTKAGFLTMRSNVYEKVNKRSVWTIATAPFSEAHFATFPPELPEICIKAGCPKSGTVLDPFGGAGTTGLVADRLQRNAVLIELNPEYAAMSRKRVDGDRGGLLDVMEAAE